MAELKQKRKFGMIDNLAYAAGDFGCNMSFALKGTLAVFWTQFMKMDSILYAALLLVVQIWDAVNDPLIGSLVDADRRKYKRNKFLAYIWAGSIGLIVGGALCFLPFPNAPQWAKGVIFIAGYIVWDAFYTVANVPYGSLLSLISNDPGDRASLSAWRSIGSLIGNMVPMVILPFLIYENNQLVGERVFLAALIMGVLGFICFQFMIRKTEIRVETEVTVSEEKVKFNIFKAMGNFLKNRPAMGVTLAVMASFIAMQGSTTAVTVMFQSYFQDVTMSGIASMFAMIPMILMTPFVRKLVDKFGKKELSVFGCAVGVVACLMMVFLPITPDKNGVMIYIVCQLLTSIGSGIFTVVSWSMMADAIDYNEWKNGAREEGTVYSLHSFFRKLSQGVGPSLVLVLMAWLGYNEANAGAQTIEVATNMRYLVAYLYLFAAVAQLLSLGLIYNLDKKNLAKMNKELAERHTKG